VWACCKRLSRYQVADSKEIGANDTLVAVPRIALQASLPAGTCVLLLS
jgi:hypothetical protein